ncbi:2-amino-3-carboxymuconate-6-semialdehyde decarboxylase-like protein [Xylogone sp. PMI_703]|nr:2-amino-3-carboxymuconate-6-semialdehyde decarboxylase-like protein [Xylogone sp. PMI_703]
MSAPIVDIHTHIYPPSYISLLKSRSTIPFIRTFSPSTSLRLIILPSEAEAANATSNNDAKDANTSYGRPIGPEYYSLSSKLSFMNTHNITISILSLANPWLDFLPPHESPGAATSLNTELNTLCGQHPGRFYFFGTLPLSSSSAEAITSEITHLKTLHYARGVIMGTTGLGNGLDDPALLPVFAALAAAKMPIFLHPHYGLPSDVFGPRREEYGHVLPLALGFPLETTIAMARMYLAGVFDVVEDLTVIIAHSGGTLPFLAGRIESCVRHDAGLMKRWKEEDEQGKPRKRKSIWEVLRGNVYLDAVVYSEVGLGAAVKASGGDRVMFGTDHPFFPPLDGEDGDGKEEDGRKWESVEMNYQAVERAFGKGSEGERDVLGGNAIRVLGLGDEIR